MSDFIRFLLDSVKFLWPFRIVHQWEVGGYYLRGKFWRTVGPGLYFMLPWFTDIIVVSVAPIIVETGRQDITLQDGKVLSFSASAVCRVVDFDKAVNRVDKYHVSTLALIQSVLADRLARVDTARVEPEARGRLLSDLQRWVQQEAEEFGVEVSKIRFTSFITNMRLHRLLMDGSPNAVWAPEPD